jgi:hypothetical protein
VSGLALTGCMCPLTLILRPSAIAALPTSD